MNIYIWERLTNITSSYHSEAGVVVAAKSETRARKMVLEYSTSHAREDYEDAEILSTVPEPDAVYTVLGKAEEKLFVFSDSGCC